MCYMCVQVYQDVLYVCSGVSRCVICVFRRIKMQYDRLHQEMQDIAVAGLIQKRPKMKASRSLPAIGLGAKHAPKPRVRFIHVNILAEYTFGRC